MQHSVGRVQQASCMQLRDAKSAERQQRERLGRQRKREQVGLGIADNKRVPLCREAERLAVA
jgi:hypothetical protein